MPVLLAFEVAFAIALVAAACTLVATLGGRADRRAILAVAAAAGAAAVSAWVAFALRLDEELGLVAGGLSAATLAVLGALPLRAALARAERIDGELANAATRLRAVADREASASAAHLERALTRARADSLSALLDEEQRLGLARRDALVEQERAAGAELMERVAAVQQRVESRLAGWAEDLERAQATLTTQITRLAERQQQLLTDAERRIQHEIERVVSTTDERRAELTREREELGRAAEALAAELRSDLETHAAERRQALEEVAERLRRRERELTKRFQDEETEAAHRIRSGFADVERRALEQLERSTQQATARYAEQAALQFADAVKRAREEAARRLSRELDRAVESYAREASSVLAERLAQVGDAGAQRLEKRLDRVAGELTRHSDELIATLEQRLLAAEADARRQLQAMIRDAEAERSVLDARLNELARRIDDALVTAGRSSRRGDTRFG